MSMTQTMRQLPVQQARTYDYLYDNVHTLSSERDHARANFKSHTSTDRVRRVPIFNTMFSALRQNPRFQMRLENTDPVPKFISRQWRGYNEQARESLIRYKTFNYAPDIQVPQQPFQDPQVGGQNRYRYFRRPIIPFLQQVPPEVVLQTSKMDPLGQPDQVMAERAPTPPFRSVEIQTDYRENETQTDPYTPEYVVRPGSQPELLTLATLSYGHGLPAGLAEVEMIERARAKREWEATLPPLNDVSQLEKRKKMMDEMERKEWALREQEIEKLQEARLELLQKILQEREENHSELSAKRLDKLWAKKQKERERKAAWIRKEHIKAIRKLTEKRRKVEGKLEKRDITKDYAGFNSETYAPMTRHGVFLDKGSEQYVVKSKYLSTYQGLLELENSLPDFVTQPRVVAPKPKVISKAGFVKRKQKKVQELDEVYRDIKTTKTRGEQVPKPLRFLQKIEKPVPRPPTPSVEVPDDVEEERELAIIFLQQVIRGRAIQNMMFEGKEKRQELINELRSTHALQKAEQQMKKQEKQETLNLQRQKRLHDTKESYIDEALSQNEGAAVGDMVDFLSKELVRLQEERRIHAFAMLAERRRRIQEAEESGARQVEERRRREEDEIFKQVIKVHQNTVDTYLEDIILASLDRTADNQAREEVHIVAEKINDIAYEMEDKKTKLQSEEIVAELVSSFLLPEVSKLTIRQKVKNGQRKHLLAAHRIIHKDAEGVMLAHPGPTANEQRPTLSGQSQEGTGSQKRSGSADKGKRSATPTGKSSRPGSATKRTSTPTKSSSRPPSGGKRDSSTPERVSSPKARPSSSSSRRGSGTSLKGSRGSSPKISTDPSTSTRPTDTTKSTASPPPPSEQRPAEPSQPDVTSSSSAQEVQPSGKEIPPSVGEQQSQKTDQPDSSTPQPDTQDSKKAVTPVGEVAGAEAVKVSVPSADDPSKPMPADVEVVVAAAVESDATAVAPDAVAADQSESKTDAPTDDASDTKIDTSPEGVSGIKPAEIVDGSKTDPAASDTTSDAAKGGEGDQSASQDAAGDKATADTQQSASGSATASSIPSGKKTADSGN